MKWQIDLTEEEYNELMKRFGKYGPSFDGVQGAIKRLIMAIANFRKIFRVPDIGFSNELYRDEDITITIRGSDGEINLFKTKAGKRICRTILVLNPDYLSKSVKHIKFS